MNYNKLIDECPPERQVISCGNQLSVAAIEMAVETIQPSKVDVIVFGKQAIEYVKSFGGYSNGYCGGWKFPLLEETKKYKAEINDDVPSNYAIVLAENGTKYATIKVVG